MVHSTRSHYPDYHHQFLRFSFLFFFLFVAICLKYADLLNVFFRSHTVELLSEQDEIRLNELLKDPYSPSSQQLELAWNYIPEHNFSKRLILQKRIKFTHFTGIKSLHNLNGYAEVQFAVNKNGIPIAIYISKFHFDNIHAGLWLVIWREINDYIWNLKLTPDNTTSKCPLRKYRILLNFPEDIEVFTNTLKTPTNQYYNSRICCDGLFTIKIPEPTPSPLP